MSKVYIYCDGGFGNRYHSLISGLFLAEACNREPLVIWPINPYNEAVYSDIFNTEIIEYTEFTGKEWLDQHDPVGIVGWNPWHANLSEQHNCMGIYTAIDRFLKDKVDFNSFQKIIEWSIKEGSHGFVPCGTTGESPTLSHEEHIKVIDECIRIVDKRVPVIAGTGSNSTDEAISLTKYAEKIGADAALVVTPYYNKPTQEGLYQHFKSINDNCSIPLIIYNIPPRSVVDMSVDTMARLFELKNIIGVKDATGDLDRVDQQKKKMGPDFIQLSGEDATALEFNMRGGVGCISVTANIASKLCSEFQEASLSKNNSNLLAKAKEINDKLMPLHKSLFIESSPSPVKYAASLLNLSSDEVRLPLVKITEETKKTVRSAMVHANLI